MSPNPVGGRHNWHMDRILIILKKENGPRASSALALGLNTIIFKHVYWYMQQISGERLQDHWSFGIYIGSHFLHIDAPYKIWLRLAKPFQRRSLKSV